MGNCQAAEAATVVIQHPSGKVERVYWSLSASQVMDSNPGHYVALIIVTSTASTSGDNKAAPAGAVKHLKLLRPDDTLLIGHVYRLVSFEEVLKEFSSKKSVRMSRLVASHEKKADTSTKRRGRGGGLVGVGCRQILVVDTQIKSPAKAGAVETPPQNAREGEAMVQWTGSGRRSGVALARQGQWRPALQSIAEVDHL